MGHFHASVGLLFPVFWSLEASMSCSMVALKAWTWAPLLSTHFLNSLFMCDRTDYKQYFSM